MDFNKVLNSAVKQIKKVSNTVMKVPEIEQKVLEATSNDPWGPHGVLLTEIARSTRNYQEYDIVMQTLWKRLGDGGKNWRHVYKSLTVLEFLIGHGSEQVVAELKEHVYQIQALTDFQFLEPGGKDQGINVRHKAATLVALLKDPAKIAAARDNAASTRNKFGGISSEEMRSRSSNFDRGGGSKYGGFGSESTGGGGDYGRGGSSHDDWERSRERAKGFGNAANYGDDDSGDENLHRDDDAPKGGSARGYGGGPGGGLHVRTAGHVHDRHSSSHASDQGYMAAGRLGGSSGRGGPATADDDDDFDPRGASSAAPPPKPEPAAPAYNRSSTAPPARAPPAPAPVVAKPAPPPPAPAANLLDLDAPAPTAFHPQDDSLFGPMVGSAPSAPPPSLFAPAPPSASFPPPAAPKPAPPNPVDLFGDMMGPAPVAARAPAPIYGAPAPPPPVGGAGSFWGASPAPAPMAAPPSMGGGFGAPMGGMGMGMGAAPAAGGWGAPTGGMGGGGFDGFGGFAAAPPVAAAPPATGMRPGGMASTGPKLGGAPMAAGGGAATADKPKGGMFDDMLSSNLTNLSLGPTGTGARGPAMSSQANKGSSMMGGGSQSSIQSRNASFF
eukprot:jgi/Mesvir1/10134/Mv06765-RA.1